jgi:intein/homing endonuclease
MFRFELENGDTFEVTPEHRFKILREGKEIEVLAKDVLDTDEFISL